MREERVRKITIAAGIILVIILLAMFVKSVVFSGKSTQTESGDGPGIKTTGSQGTAGDSSQPVYIDAGGKRVIQWEKIEVPDWIERDLLPTNEYSRPGTALDDVDGIVVHYTANPGTTAKQNRNYFAGLADGSSGTYASSHFIIDTDGTILQCVPMSEVAYASNNRNSNTISIECCHEDESGKFTKATYQSLVKLIAWLADTYLIDTEDIIRHYDITGKICPKYFVDNEDKWEKFLKEVDKAR